MVVSLFMPEWNSIVLKIFFIWILIETMPNIILLNIIFSYKTYVWSKIIRQYLILNERSPRFCLSSNFTKKRITVKSLSIKIERIVSESFVRINPVCNWFFIVIYKPFNWKFPNICKIKKCICTKSITISSAIINSI